MNINTEKTKKQKAGRLLIGFIITMALLTFFSGTINNISMPIVSVASPEQGTLQKVVSANGTFVSGKTVPVNIKYAGKVKTVAAKAGDTVKVGDTLLILDTEDLNRQLDEEQSTLKKLKNNRKKLSLSYTPQDTTQLQVANKTAKECVDEAQAAFNNIEQEFQTGMATEAQLAAAKKALKDAKNQYEISKSALSYANKQASKQKKSNKLDIDNMDLDIAAQQEKVDDLKSFVLNDGKLVSPISGRIKKVNVQEGGMTETTQPVMELTSATGGLEFQADVSNEDAQIIPEGAKLDILPSGSARLMPVTLREKKASAAEPGKQTTLFLTVKAEDVAANSIQPDQSGDVRYTQQTSNYDLILPNGAIRGDSTGSFVLVAEKKDTPLGKQTVLRRVDVKIMDSDSLRSAVTGALSQKDDVVTDSDKPVEDGDKVGIASAGKQE